MTYICIDIGAAIMVCQCHMVCTTHVIIQEGQVVNLNFEFVNISQIDFKDSILVEWEFNNTTTKKVERFSKKIPAVKSGEKYEFTIEFNSVENQGTTFYINFPLLD